MKRVIAITWASALALCGAANAADVYSTGPGGYKDGPAYLPWSGFYAGVNGGYGWANGQTATVSSNRGGAVSGSVDVTGGFGGFEVGYNWQSVWNPRVVFGIEADIQAASFRGTSSFTNGNIYGQAGLEVETAGTVRGRLGYTFGPALIYGTGGLAYSQIKNYYSYVDGAGNAGGASTNYTWDTGWVAGAGLEYRVSPSWSLKAEYLYFDFGSTTSNGSLSTSPSGTVKGEASISASTARVGLNYFFNNTPQPLK